ncbi:MAG: hypothetical protein R1F54_04885 [Candidatus Zeuxoniibacter abyssi]|nr:MAG: hypothetical protein R1F54_04885 [Candidatus Persebacteraceae bacterium AB1(2)]
MPYYGLANAKVGGCDCVVSQTGFSGEAGYEIYLRDATIHAEVFWNAILDAGKKHELMVTAPPHCRRIQAGYYRGGRIWTINTTPFNAIWVIKCRYRVSVSGIKSATTLGAMLWKKLKRTWRRVKNLTACNWSD